MFRGPQAELFDEEPPLYDTIDQILRQLGAGEDSRTEFKELGYGKGGVISPRTENLSAEMVAFANAEGGMFIFGVDDSGAPAGVPRDSLDAVEQWIINVASDLCDPPIRPVLRRAVVPGADRLEVYSPGGLPNGITVHSMAYRTFTRNQLLVSFLSRMRSARTGRYYLESRGEGGAEDSGGGRSALGSATGV